MAAGPGRPRPGGRRLSRALATVRHTPAVFPQLRARSFPPIPTRPSRSLNAAAAIRTFRSAGARRVIANGALGPAGLAAGGRVALITGPPGVGKSTTGFCFYLKCLSAGLTAGYADLAQVGFLRPAAAADPGGHRLKARNLAAIWRNYRAAGATHLVVTGMIASQADDTTGLSPDESASMTRQVAGWPRPR